MPTYEFRCPDGTIIERVFKISEVPNEIPVPNGDGVATRIISGGAALLFKGSGFYITDYGKDGKNDQRASSGEKSASSDSASSSSSASPPASPSSSTSKSD
jgi:predicted nucleic acid-binding Zn ribbon protein